IVQPQVGVARRDLRLFAFPGGEPLSFPSETFEEWDPSRIYPAEFSPDGKLLLTRRYIQERDTWLLRLLDVPSGAERFRIESGDPCAGCLSAHGRKLAYLSKIGPRIRVCDVAAHTDAASDMAGVPLGISPDGRALLTQKDSRDLGNSTVRRTLVLWDIENGHEVQRFNTVTRRGWPAPFRFSPDGTKLAVDVANEERGEELKLWDTATG